MVNKHVKKCSRLSPLGKMQIKAAGTYFLTPTRMAIIQKIITSVGKNVEKCKHLYAAGVNGKTVP